MTTQIIIPDLLSACTEIFGKDVDISVDFLKYLQPVGLKTAYRKKALETHPDRAKALGKFEAEMNEKFKSVRHAYELLLTFVENGNKNLIVDVSTYPGNSRPYSSTDYSRETKKRKKTRSQKQQYQYTYRHHSYSNPSDHYYTGNLPNRELLIGQFLYYSGKISWRTYINAILWQKKQRPTIGRIALEWGILSHNDIIRILSQKGFKEKFGECALRLGLLSSFQHLALIGKQRGLQRPIGKYFIEKRIFGPETIVADVAKQKMHNKNFLNPYF